MADFLFFFCFSESMVIQLLGATTNILILSHSKLNPNRSGVADFHPAVFSPRRRMVAVTFAPRGSWPRPSWLNRAPWHTLFYFLRCSGDNLNSQTCFYPLLSANSHIFFQRNWLKTGAIFPLTSMSLPDVESQLCSALICTPISPLTGVLLTSLIRQLLCTLPKTLLPHCSVPLQHCKTW